MDKYVIPLEYIKKYLLKTVGPISIFAHGSYVIKSLFNQEFSDIDIIAIVENLKALAQNWWGNRIISYE